MNALVFLLALFVGIVHSLSQSQEQIAFSMENINEKRPFVPQDMVNLNRIGAIQLSPSGELAVFSKWTYDSNADKSIKHLYLLELKSKQTYQLTFGEVSDDDFVWLNNESLVYLSKQSGKAHRQLFKLQVSSSGPVGEPQQLTGDDFHYDISNLKYIPSGNYLAFSSEVYVDTKDSASSSLKDTFEKDQMLSKDHSSAKTFDKLYFRHWDEYDNHKNSHLFTLPLDFTSLPLDFDKSRNLLKGIREFSCPIPPFGDGSQFEFSADGKEVLFASMKNFDKSIQAWSTETHIYRLAVETAGNAPECLSCDQGVGAKTAPKYSPDGKYISWLQMKVPQFEADKNNLIVMEVKSGKKVDVTVDWDRSIHDYVWSADGKTVYVTAEEYGRTKVFAADLKTKSVQVLFQEGVTSSIQVIPNSNALLLSQSSLRRPTEFLSLEVSSGKAEQLTQLHTEYLSHVEMVAPEEFWFTGSLNEKVMGWMLKPANFDPKKKYPLAFLIHGGPQSSWLDSFSTRWNPQVYTGAGYVVVMVNFHGSTGYGQKFTDSISKEWGNYPFHDLMKGLDFVLQEYRFIDRKRVAGLGASYGGFMINWLNGHTDRFNCLVNHDGLFDVKSMYYTTEELYFSEYEFAGTPYDNMELYDKWNPSAFVKNWKTPTLVIHGGKDYRVPQGEGFATFTALQRKGVPSRLVFFPDENHWVLKPANSMRWHKEVLAWINKWTA